jgi:hypothetical protein
MTMTLQEFTAFHDNAPEHISRIQFVVADHPDAAERKEWIHALVSIDVPTVRNGALLRVAALERAIDTLSQLRNNLRTLADQSR